MPEGQSFDEELVKAIRLIRDHHHTKAIHILNRLLAVDPNCWRAWEERGWARKFSGDLKGAFEDFSEMISRWPDDPKGYTERADVHASAGHLQNAIDDYTSAIAIQPEHPYAYPGRGGLRATIGDYSGSLADFDTHLALFNDDDQQFLGWYGRGHTRMLQGDLLGAITDLTEAMRFEWGDPIRSCLVRGHARLAAADFCGATKDFSRAIEYYPQLPNAYRLRAEARSGAGDAAGAAEDHARYDQLGGEDFPAWG